MRLNLWHKSLLAGVAILPFGLWVSHSDLSLKGDVKFSSAQCQQRKLQSYRLSNTSTPDSLIDVFQTQLLRLMRKEGLRGGVSVAISKGGRLVFAKGFGYSNIADSIEMQPYNVMRVASVSKLITAVAVMRLVDSGKLMLDQKVFGPTEY